MKDGLHTLQGYDVLVENGTISRGLKNHGYTYTYVYRWNKSARAWINETNISPAAFIAGVKRNTIKMI